MENSNKSPIKEPRKFTFPYDAGTGLGYALLAFGIAYFFYYTMTNYEKGESITMNRLLLIVYKLAGKNLTTGVISAVGVLCLYFAIQDIIKANKR